MSGVVCDFCNGTEATHAMRCDPLAVRATGPIGVAVAALSGDWRACDDCLPFVQRGDPDGLANHVTMAANGPPELLRMTTETFRRDVFKALYRKVLPWLGAPQPLAREAVGAGGRKETNAQAK